MFCKQTYGIQQRKHLTETQNNVIKYFCNKFKTDRYEILGTFQSNLVYSDIDLNITTSIRSLRDLYDILSSLPQKIKIDDFHYVYADLKISSEHFSEDEIYNNRDKLKNSIMKLKDKSGIIKHDILYFDPNSGFFREASAFVFFDGKYAGLISERDIVGSLIESYNENMDDGNYVKAAKRLYSLTKAVGNPIPENIMNKIFKLLTSVYNQMSIMISCIDTMRILLFHTIDNGMDHYINISKQTIIEEMQTLDINIDIDMNYVSSVLENGTEDMYINLIDNIRNINNEKTKEFMVCSGIDLNRIFDVVVKDFQNGSIFNDTIMDNIKYI